MTVEGDTFRSCTETRMLSIHVKEKDGSISKLHNRVGRQGSLALRAGKDTLKVCDHVIISEIGPQPGTNDRCCLAGRETTTVGPLWRGRKLIV